MGPELHGLVVRLEDLQSGPGEVRAGFDPLGPGSRVPGAPDVVGVADGVGGVPRAHQLLRRVGLLLARGGGDRSTRRTTLNRTGRLATTGPGSCRQCLVRRTKRKTLDGIVYCFRLISSQSREVAPHDQPADQRNALRTDRGTRRPHARAGSPWRHPWAPRSSGTTSSSTGPPPAWSSTSSTSTGSTARPRSSRRSAPSPSASWPARSAACSSATSATGSAASRCCCSPC